MFDFEYKFQEKNVRYSYSSLFNIILERKNNIPTLSFISALTLINNIRVSMFKKGKHGDGYMPDIVLCMSRTDIYCEIYEERDDDEIMEFNSDECFCIIIHFSDSHESTYDIFSVIQERYDIYKATAKVIVSQDFYIAVPKGCDPEYYISDSDCYEEMEINSPLEYVDEYDCSYERECDDLTLDEATDNYEILNKYAL